LFAKFRILASQGQLVESAGLTYPVEGTVGPIGESMDDQKKAKTTP
jgi:hypothetical protein